MGSTNSGVSRRRLLGLAGLLGTGGMLPAAASAGQRARAAAPAAPSPDGVYRAIGVRPLINCRGTFTIIGGSIELPEVRAAKDAANQRHAHLDEVMDAVGARLAQLTGAEWGMVSAGCAAAMSHATAACVAGGNPDLHVRIPNLEGFARDEVIIPTHSRNVYDAAIRAVGVRIIEVDGPEALQLAIGPRTAMIYIFAEARNETGPLSTETICGIAARHGVPVLVDAAAEGLTIPNIHLGRGATLVAYSGGKYIRGPQSAGLLLGRKDLVQAAWIHSAPHHGYARSMKVGREEMIAMLAAVESWVRRDHAAEWETWVARCEHIADRVSRVAGVTASVQREPGESLSNRSPRVVLRWHSQRLGLTGPEVVTILDTTEPRIALGPAGRGAGRAPAADAAGDTGIAIVSAMMGPGDERRVAERIAQVLSAPRTPSPVVPPAAPAADVSGRWEVEIAYAAITAMHEVHLVQDGSRLDGVHRGNFVSRPITGAIDGADVSLASIVTERHGDALTYRFTGRVTGETIAGALDLGEYRRATWSARRTAG